METLGRESCNVNTGLRSDFKLEIHPDEGKSCRPVNEESGSECIAQ